MASDEEASPVLRAKRIAKKEAERLSGAQDVLCVLLRGSLFRGRLARGCDIDLVLITRATRKKEIIHSDGFDIDCRYYPLDSVASGVQDGDVQMIEHVMNSEFLAGDSDVHTKLRKIIDEAPFRQLSIRFLGRATHRMNDAQDEIEYGDHEAAVMTAREAMTLLANAILLRNHIVCTKDKYLVKEVRKLSSQFPEFVERFFTIHGLVQSGVKADDLILEVAASYMTVERYLRESSP